MIKELFETANDNKISFSAVRSNDEITIIIELGDKPPISLVDNINTVDESLLTEISSAFNETTQIRSSIAFFKRQLELKEKELKEKAMNKPKTAPAKNTTAAPATPSLFDSSTAKPSEESNDSDEFEEFEDSVSDDDSEEKMD